MGSPRKRRQRTTDQSDCMLPKRCSRRRSLPALKSMRHSWSPSRAPSYVFRRRHRPCDACGTRSADAESTAYVSNPCYMSSMVAHVRSPACLPAMPVTRLAIAMLMLGLPCARGSLYKRVDGGFEQGDDSGERVDDAGEIEGVPTVSRRPSCDHPLYGDGTRGGEALYWKCRAPLNNACTRDQFWQGRRCGTNFRGWIDFCWVTAPIRLPAASPSNDASTSAANSGASSSSSSSLETARPLRTPRPFDLLPPRRWNGVIEEIKHECPRGTTCVEDRTDREQRERAWCRPNHPKEDQVENPDRDAYDDAYEAMRKEERLNGRWAAYPGELGRGSGRRHVDGDSPGKRRGTSSQLSVDVRPS